MLPHPHTPPRCGGSPQRSSRSAKFTRRNSLAEYDYLPVEYGRSVPLPPSLPPAVVHRFTREGSTPLPSRPGRARSLALALTTQRRPQGKGKKGKKSRKERGATNYRTSYEECKIFVTKVRGLLKEVRPYYWIGCISLAHLKGPGGPLASRSGG